MSTRRRSVTVSIENCRLIEFPEFKDARGSLTCVEANDQVPFDIQRVYYLHDLPRRAVRGGHAHREQKRVILAVAGGFDAELEDGRERKHWHLNCPHVGLYVDNMIWSELRNFSSGSVVLVLASGKYDDHDYVRSYAEYLDAVRDV